MKQKWVGLYVPGIPSKIVIVPFTQGKLRPDVIENRRKQLHTFCESVAACDYLYRSEEFQLFVKGRDSFEKEMQKLSLPQLESTRKMYEELFQREEERTEVAGIEEFQGKVSENVLRAKHFKLKLKSLSAYHASLESHHSTFCSSLQSYEALCYSQYSDIPVGRVVSTAVSEEPSPFLTLRDWAASEYIESKSMLEAMESRSALISERVRVEKLREELKRKVAKKEKGRRSFSLAAFFSKRKTKESLAKQLEEADRKVADLAVVLMLSERWLATVQIPTFRECREKAYFAAMEKFTRETKAHAEILKESFRIVGMIV